MKLSCRRMYCFAPVLELLLLVGVHGQLAAQATMRQRIPAHRTLGSAVSASATKEQAMSVGNYSRMGNEADGYAYLATKESCDFEKTVDDSGCVVIAYADGGKKKVCNGLLFEVITPDGVRHPIRNWSIKQYVMKIDPPQNPTQTDVSYKWINSFNAEELSEIGKCLRTDEAMAVYLKREYASCKDNIYKQMEYRSIFLQEYYKAK